MDSDGCFHVVDGRPAPHPTHEWKEPDRRQTRCVGCGAYRHLSSGFWPCKRKKIAPLAALAIGLRASRQGERDG